MDFAKAIKQTIGIYKLDKTAISEVASNKESTKIALVFVFLGGVLNGISSGLLGIILTPLFYLTGLVIGVGFYHFLARLFGGRGELMQFFRVSGYLSIAYWVSVIPVIGPIISFLLMLWSIIVSIVLLKTVYKLSTIRAVIVELIPLMVFGGIFLLILVVMSWQLGVF